MNPTNQATIALACGIALLVGCSKSQQNPGLVKVSGIVHVDGKPASGVVLSLVPKNETDQQSAGSISTGITGEDGSFAISTYAAGDGALPGDYAVTCVWSEFDPVSRSQRGDQLNGRYATKDKTTVHWKIGESAPYNAGTVALQR